MTCHPMCNPMIGCDTFLNKILIKKESIPAQERRNRTSNAMNILFSGLLALSQLQAWVSRLGRLFKLPLA